MFCLPAKFPTIRSFAQSESGVVAVDFVVLTGAATGVAMATMAAFSAELGFVSGEVASQSQHRESRPSYAYRAHDEETYQRYTSVVSSLSNNDLAVLSAWGNATRAQSDALAGSNAQQFFEDFDQAITSAYANREQSRDDEVTEYDEYDLERVSRMLGFS